MRVPHVRRRLLQVITVNQVRFFRLLPLAIRVACPFAYLAIKSTVVTSRIFAVLSGQRPVVSNSASRDTRRKTTLFETPFAKRLIHPNSASVGTQLGRQLRRPRCGGVVFGT